jgi:ATP-dependent protease Clp ATPase subunit
MEPKGALVRQYQALRATEGLTVEFAKDGLEEIADIAVQVNERTENIGARRALRSWNDCWSRFPSKDRSGRTKLQISLPGISVSD